MPGVETLVRAFRTGLASVRANVAPMAVLWLLALSLVVGYGTQPSVSATLRSVADWQAAHHVAGSMLNRVVFCGLLPGLFLFVRPSVRPAQCVLAVVVTMLWNVAWAVPFDLFFRLQAELFGSSNDFPTLLCKLLVDQFVWTVFLVAPANAAFFLWMGSGFSSESLRRAGWRRFCQTAYLPNLISNWCVWIPVVLAIYVFPTDLQIHVSGLVGSFWILLSLELGRRAAAEGQCRFDRQA